MEDSLAWILESLWPEAEIILMELSMEFDCILIIEILLYLTSELLSSQLELELQASVLFIFGIDEGESQAVGPGGSEAGDVILVCELHGISRVVALRERSHFFVKEHSI